MWILVLKWSGRNMAMNFVALRIVSNCFHRLLRMANCPAKRFVVWEKKTRQSSSCRGSIIAFNTKITRGGGGTRKCCLNVTIRNSKKEQHLIVPTTFTFFPSELHLFPWDSTNYFTMLEKVRLVINQGHCGEQVVGAMLTKYLPQGPLYFR